MEDRMKETRGRMCSRRISRKVPPTRYKFQTEQLPPFLRSLIGPSLWATPTVNHHSSCRVHTCPRHPSFSSRTPQHPLEFPYEPQSNGRNRACGRPREEEDAFMMTFARRNTIYVVPFFLSLFLCSLEGTRIGESRNTFFFFFFVLYYY